MKNGTTFVGLDVHVATIAIASCREDGTQQEHGIIPNEIGVLAKRLAKIGSAENLAVCYEAGPCGFTLYRQLTKRGIACTVIAPSLIPKKPGNRIKTDRRDALHLARSFRNGDLTAVTVPSPELEAIRDLSRLRQAAIGDLHRTRQRLIKLFPRIGIVEPAGKTRWSQGYLQWVDGINVSSSVHTLVLTDLRSAITAGQVRVDQLTEAVLATAEDGPFAPVVAGLQELHGVGVITAVGLVAEIGDFTRFSSPVQLMGFTGLVPSEHSSGGNIQRGPITKTGNAHVRGLLVEAAWHYARPARPRPDPTTERERIAAIARDRLHRRYCRLVSRGRPKGIAIVAVARELLGFCWAIAREVQASTAATPAIAD